MELPDSGHMDTAAGVVEVLKRQAHHVHGYCCGKFTAVGRKSEAFGKQLLRELPPRRAEAVHMRCFHDHARRILVRRIRNLQMQIAVARSQPCKLQKSVPNVKHLQFNSHTRRVEGWLKRHAPFQNGPYCDVSHRNLRQVNVLGISAKIGAGRLALNAVTQVLWVASTLAYDPG